MGLTICSWSTGSTGLERRQASWRQEAAEAALDLSGSLLPDRRGRIRDPSLFDLAIDKRIHSCDLVNRKSGAGWRCSAFSAWIQGRQREIAGRAVRYKSWPVLRLIVSVGRRQSLRP